MACVTTSPCRYRSAIWHRFAYACEIAFLTQSFRGTMGKHFSAAELDPMQLWKSKSDPPTEVWCKLKTDRLRKRMAGPSLTCVCRALKGMSFMRTRVKSRGRKPTLTAVNVRALCLQPTHPHQPDQTGASCPNQTQPDPIRARSAHRHNGFLGWLISR